MSVAHVPTDLPLAGVNARVITASSRAAAGVYPDRGGELIVATLRGWGAQVPSSAVVADGVPVVDALRAALEQGPDLIVTTGGTGLTPTDGTPEATLPLIDRLVPGVTEAIRAYGVAQGVPTAALSRGIAGVAGRCFIVNLPGSTGGVRDGLHVIEPMLAHVLAQIRGGDH